MWEKRNLGGVLPDQFDDAASAVTKISKVISSTSSALENIADLVKEFYFTIGDPFSRGVQAVVDTIEDRLNSILGLGVYALYVSPDKVDNPNFSLISGLATLPPTEALNKVISSFDDKGDDLRPKFGETETVAGLAIMLTATDIQSFVLQLERFIRVFGYADFVKLYERYKNYTIPRDRKYRSRKPDWDNLTLRKLPFLQDVDEQVTKFLTHLKGYTIAGDNALTDFISVIEKKIRNIDRGVERIERAFNALKDGLSATGVYWTYIEENTGGNRYLKEELLKGREVFLQERGLEYSVMIVLVAGGPDKEGLKFLASLFEG